MATSLQLQRPLVVLDLETTGLDVKTDRIVEIACIMLRPDGSRARLHRRINPEVPIAPQATRVHGIADADVAAAPTFAQLAAELWDFLAGCDLAGYNVERFDLPLLIAEFARVQRTYPAAPMAVVDSLRVFLCNERRDLASALKFYCNAELQQAHSAAADAEAAADILMAQLDRYPDMPRDAAGLGAYSRRSLDPDSVDSDGKLLWREGRPVLNFGKYRNRALEELVREDPSYLQWVAGGSFSAEVTDLINAALAGQMPVRPERHS